MQNVSLLEPATTAGELNLSKEAVDRQISDARFAASFSRRLAQGDEFVSASERDRFAKYLGRQKRFQYQLPAANS